MGGGGGAPNPAITPELGNIYHGFNSETLPTFNSFVQGQPDLAASQTLSSGAVSAVTPQVLSILQNQGALTPEESRDVTQTTRAAFSARGNVMGNQAIGAELLNRDSARKQNEQFALGLESGTITPALQTEQTATNSFATLVNPLYSLFENAQNAATSLQVANTNKQAGVEAGALDAIGSIAGSAIKASDERLKENIDEVGEIMGLPIKTFQYKGDPRKFIGVVAQDVEEIVPEAVVEMDSGFKAVDYEKLLPKGLNLLGVSAYA